MIMSYLFRFDKHLHRGAYIRPSVVGSHSLRAGMYVTGISEMKIAATLFGNRHKHRCTRGTNKIK